jgi:hypothetical protein
MIKLAAFQASGGAPMKQRLPKQRTDSMFDVHFFS